MKRTLFILALSAVALSSAHAAVGDVVTINANNPYFIEGIVDTTPDLALVTSVDKVNSTRFYDSNKGGPWTRPYSDGTVGDHNMCWSHVATNAIQYWQDVYGVFYTDKGYMETTNSGSARSLNNGFYSVTTVTDYDTLVNGQYAKVQVGNAMELNVARAFYSDWGDAAGKFTEGVDWYFRGGIADKSRNFSGGYYSECFGDSSAYVSTAISSDMGVLKNAITEALGLESQGNGQYMQAAEGLLAGVSIAYEKDGYTYGHAINCVGVTFDSSGNLSSLIITNGDMGLNNKPGTAEIQNVYVQSDPFDDGKIKLYTNTDCTELWIAGREYYIREVAYINTPEVLQNMLSEYRDTNEAAVWSGTSSEWSTQVDVVDSEIADASTGWDVYVDGSTGKEIAEQHHGYYHGYALEGRNVLFDNHAAVGNRTVTINGTVSAGHIEVAAAGYQFKKGTDGAIAAGADMTVRSGASLDSDVELKLGDLELEQGALLSSSKTITVKGAFLTSLQESASFSLRNAVTPSVSVDADLDLTMATSITLNTAVDMNGHDLFLNADRPITISLSEVDGSILFFTNVGTLSVLTIEGITEVITPGTDLTQYFSIKSTDGADLSGYSLVYANDALSMSIVPEPTTATLSLLALAALAARRRRK